MNSQTTGDNSESRISDARGVSTVLLNRAKIWWGLCLTAKVSVFIVGAVSALASIAPQYAAFAITLLAVVSELLRLHAAAIRSTGEDLRRKIDYHDSIGWAISTAELSDAVLSIGSRCLAKVKANTTGSYFASTATVGPQRGIQNLQESAWFSKHLAKTSGWLCASLTMILVVISTASLLVSIEIVQSSSTLHNIGRVVTSALMLVFSLDLIPLSLGYLGFAHKAGHIERESHALEMASSCELITVVKLWQDYHIARNVAPLIPTWIWRMRRSALNEMWNEYRS